jgi:acyl-CoA reductase-like NAD-dependent aldehyde dehydrogenase
MDLCMMESFGLTVSLTSFENKKKALRIANDTAYGLSSVVFSRDLRGPLAIARQVETGAVHIKIE